MLMVYTVGIGDQAKNFECTVCCSARHLSDCMPYMISKVKHIRTMKAVLVFASKYVLLTFEMKQGNG